ncbi:MAG: hypothetical protein JWN64_371 [Parcubacteria group bacterium]|nr:hypothetical protein [Parcubacteria group bacterium]
MTIEQITAFVQSPWALVILIVVIISGVWYFIKEGAKAAKGELNAKTPLELFKTFVYGKPLILILVAVVIIGVIMAVTHYQISQIGQ